MTSLTRQFLNCWLEYVLSQPVDLDISVILKYLRSYLGITIFLSFLKSEDAIVGENEIDHLEMNETAAGLVPQESYS
jgi:hypothetical protein